MQASENGEVRSNEQLETTLEERIEELRHRLRIEAAVVDGAKNVIRTLQSTKTIDKKALQEVSAATFYYTLKSVTKQKDLCESFFHEKYESFY
jgi:iron only hydrogenase large subunit-like protein